jgi:serine/threonine-protein kinase RsbW
VTVTQQQDVGRTRVEDRVELRVPADPAYLTVLRTATAGLAARMDLTLDEIEDLRIAVDEACALVLTGATDVSAPATGDAGGSREQLRAEFEIGTDVLAVRVTGPARSLPERSSFAWAVLEALVGEIETGEEDGHSVIVLRHHRARRLR